MPSPSSLRRSQVEATRRAILTSARRRFARLGFAATSLDDVTRDAGVTKGALYHHFRNKEQLFAEVYDDVEAELSRCGIAAAAGAGDPLDALRRGFGAFLDRALEPDMQRIALIDAGAVLGPAAKLEIDTRHSLAAIRAAVEAGMAQGQIDHLDPEALAQLLLAACCGAAQLVATDPDPATARARVGATLDRLVAGLAPG